MNTALSGAAWASLGAGVLVAVLIVGAVLLVTRGRAVPPDEPPPEEPHEEAPEEHPEDVPAPQERPKPPPLDTTMIRWDRTLPPVPPPKRREQP
jgi:hypothetical protein